MQRNRRILFVILGLIIFSLGCRLISGTDEPTRRPTPLPEETAVAISASSTPKAPPSSGETADATPTVRPKTTRSTPTPELPEPPTREAGHDGFGLEVVNETNQDIWYLYFSLSDSSEWGDDQLGGDIIPAGESYLLTGIPDGTYDIQARNSDGDTIQTGWELVVTNDATWYVSAQTTVEINNTSDTAIAFLYISPSDSDSWGPDFLNGNVIPINGSYTVENIEAGTYDIQAKDAEQGVVETIYHVPLDGDHFWNIVGLSTVPANAVVRFTEDFTDNRHNWGLNSPEGAIFTPPANGEFCIEIVANNMTAWEWYEPFRPDQFLAEINCSAEWGTDATCGIGFGPDADNLYWFEVAPYDQTFALFLLLNNEWQEAPIAWTTSKNIMPNGWNYLSLGRINGVVSVYINGVLQATVNSNHFPTGRIGLGGSTYSDNNVTVCMDDLRVWRME